MLIMELEADGDSSSMDINLKIKKFRWRIENFSSIKDIKLYSEDFCVNGCNWRVLIFPTGNHTDHLSLYLSVADSAKLCSGWSRYAQFGLAIIDQYDRKTSISKVTTHEFTGNHAEWGFTSFMALSELHNPGRGYLINDACVVEAYVSSYRTTGLISHELIVKTEFDKHKAAIDDQQTTITKPIDITTPSPSHPSSLAVAVEPEEPTEEDISKFFTILDSKLSSSNIVFSREEAKEALDKVEEALNMTPVNFYDSRKFSPLKHAFKILASLDCSSTTLTIEQKDELLAMEDRLKKLADQASKAVSDKNRLTEKESVKLAITRNLDHNLARYKEVESEVKRLLAERKEIFKSSKKMKMDLEALEKEWPQCEANARVAEAEEEILEMEWGRMKDFITSIKEHWNEQSTMRPKPRLLNRRRRRRRLLIQDFDE